MDREIVHFVISQGFISQQQLQQILVEQRASKKPLLHMLEKYLTAGQRQIIEQKISQNYAVAENQKMEETSQEPLAYHTEKENKHTEEIDKSQLMKVFYEDAHQDLHFSQEQIPKFFGRFEIIKELGKGNMGCVFLAKDSQRNDPIALKVMLHGNMVDSISDKRFVREVELVQEFNHPNIVEVYETGKEKGIRYFTMKYIKGPSFAEALSKKIGFDTCAQILSKTARAVHYAHSNNVVHRDLKPENILLENDEPMVIDFGLARPIHGDAKLTATGVISGTAHFMAPEQIKKTDTIDARTDIYALGASLYYALSKQTPFKGEEVFDILSQILHKDPTPLRKINPCIPQKLANICHKAMAKDKQKRFSSALEMAENLEDFLESDSYQELPKKQWKKQKITMILAIVFAVVSTVLILKSTQPEIPKKNLAKKTQIPKKSQSKKSVSSKTSKIFKVSDKDIELANSYYNLAAMYCKQGLYDKAISSFNAALKQHPLHTKAYNGRGFCYFKKQKFSIAVTDFSKAIELNPKKASFYDNRGSAYRHQQLYKKAIKDYSKALELNPKDISALCNRALTYRAIELYDKSISDYARVIKISPHDPQHYLKRAETYRLKKAYDKAILDYSESIKISPTAFAYHKRGFVYESKEDYHRAILDYGRAIKLSPNPYIHCNNRGFCYYKIKKYKKAVQDFQQSIKLNPKNGISYNNRGLVYFDKGKYNKALSDFSKAIAFSPRYKNAYYNRALLYQTLGHNEKAQKDLEKYKKLLGK